MSDRAQELLERFRDQRSRRVVFISHCLLNENVRYLGGAFQPGAVREALAPFLNQGIGIVQMPCPEQRAWGGVLKRRTLRYYGSSRRLGPAALLAFRGYTRWMYWRLARRVVRDLEDYLHSGFEVVGIVGIAGSPSCGVARTLDLRRSLPVIADPTIDRDNLNARAIAECVIPGRGLFVEALRRRLHRRGLEVPFLEFDLVAEIHGQPRPITPAGQ
jgi:predicted secreted protein